jgi:dCMP deaminase
MNRLSWDEYFGLLTQVIALRSDDENTKIGAIIVDHKNRIVSTGYNGTPRGTDLPKTRPEKYPYMVHAEENAMLFAQGDLHGCRIYVLGMTPCNVCARMMLQKGIEEVIIVNPIIREQGANWNFEATYNMFSQVGMGFREIKVPFINIEREINLDC